MRGVLLSLLSLAAGAMAAPQPEAEAQVVQPGPGTETKPFPIGDGDPYQVYLYKQLTDRSHCGSSGDSVSCSVGETDMESYSVSWGASISAAGWITAGFSVSKSITTGNTHLCTNDPGDGGPLKDYICIWKRVGHTEYTVSDWSRPSTGCCDWKEETDPYQMWSPNSDNIGQDYVCAWDDECWNKGDEWWGPSREPGGPRQYEYDEKWQ